MVEHVRSWLKDNQTLVFFLLAQIIAIGAAGVGILTYMVRLEVRVNTMETRGAEYTVARMDEMKQRITVLEQNIRKNESSIERIVNALTRDLK